MVNGILKNALQTENFHLVKLARWFVTLVLAEKDQRFESVDIKDGLSKRIFPNVWVSLFFLYKSPKD